MPHDLLEMTTKILEFIDFQNEPNTDKLREKDIAQYNFVLNKRFSTLPSTMIRLLSDKERQSENLEKVLEMISLISSMQTGEKTYEEAENEFAEKRSEEYIYPLFGGKENFLKATEEKKREKEKQHVKK